jgi:RNA polymerase sigma-70 factor (ECF subfamily)
VIVLSDDDGPHGLAGEVPTPDAYAAVLARVRAGDPAALDELLGRAQAIARRYSLAVCGSAPDRDDAMQEALLKTFRHAGRIREPRAFRAWLYRTVKNACLIGRRRTAFEKATDSLSDAPAEPPARGPAADERIQSAQARVRVQQALARLRPAYREAVFLRDLEGLSTREVARVLGLTEANVKVRLHRAHAQLKRELGDAEPPVIS